MAMSKKDFIALADAIRAITPPEHLPLISRNAYEYRLEGEHAQHMRVISALADFCRSQNPRFMRGRWTEYIAGNCGPNGGTPKRNAFEEVERGFYSRKNGGGR